MSAARDSTTDQGSSSEQSIAPPAADRHWQSRAEPAVDAAQYGAWCGDRITQMMAAPAVQRDGGDAAPTGDAVHAAAARGTETPSTSLPFGGQIQAAFGGHDISHVQAHVGGGAADACADMGASAYASGSHVAFAQSPDLHTAAHEAAHVVQQAQGVNLYGGVGAAGDSYERHADAVADAVVAGNSAEELLSIGPNTPAPAGGWGGVQRKIAAPIVQRDGEQPLPDPGQRAPVAKLHLYADIEAKSMGLAQLKEGQVGHTWIALEYIDPAAVPDTVPAEHKALLENGGKYADPMGFWPDTPNGVYYNPNPFNSYVQGWMRHPDQAHEGSEKASQSWSLTQGEVDSVIAYAESKKGAQYSVFFFNCTHFGVGAVKAAGKSAPSATMAGIAMPNALYEGIKKRQDKGVGETMTKELDGSNEHIVEGANTEKKG